MKTTIIIFVSVFFFSLINNREGFSQEKGISKTSEEEKTIPPYPLVIPLFSVDQILIVSDESTADQEDSKDDVLSFTNSQILGLTEFDAPEEIIYEPLPGNWFESPEEPLDIKSLGCLLCQLNK